MQTHGLPLPTPYKGAVIAVQEVKSLHRKEMESVISRSERDLVIAGSNPLPLREAPSGEGTC